MCFCIRLLPTPSAGTPLSCERVYDSKRKLEIIVYKVLNMDIIITKTLLTPRSRVDYFYDGWMDALYWTSNLNSHSLTAIIKLGRARTFFI